MGGVIEPARVLFALRGLNNVSPPYAEAERDRIAGSPGFLKKTGTFKKVYYPFLKATVIIASHANRWPARGSGDVRARRDIETSKGFLTLWNYAISALRSRGGNPDNPSRAGQLLRLFPESTL